MKKELCFIINGKELFLEQTLVEYNDVPIYYICKDEEVFYTVLCTDVNNLKYVIVNSKIKDMALMLHGNITMRDLLLRSDTFWEVVTGDDIESDIVTLKDMKDLNKSDLPDESSYFGIYTDQIRCFVDEFDKAFYGGKFEEIDLQDVKYVNAKYIEINPNINYKEKYNVTNTNKKQAITNHQIRTMNYYEYEELYVA